MSFSVADYTWPAFQGRKPFEHQKKTVLFELANPRCLILNDMGTGKTLAALWGADILLTANKIRRILIISPLSTMGAVWYNEVMLNIPHRKAVIAHGSPTKRQAALRDPTAHFVIINHDGIKSAEDEIIRQGFDLIIIDELTAYKANSERTKCMERIAKRVRAVWGMTGDLTPNSPVEAYYPCRIVVPHSKWLPKYYGQFRDACMTQINEMIWVPKPEAPQIVSMVAQPSIRFTRDQCLDLPDTTYQQLSTELSSTQKEYYKKMAEEAIIQSDSGSVTAQSAAIMLNKLLQISAGAVRNDDGQTIKIGAPDRISMLLDLFEQTPQKKMVVFATYRASIEMVVDELTKKGIRVGAIHGDVPQNIRAGLIHSFQNGDLQVIVLQPQSAAHGITLTASSTIVWYSLIASNELYEQGNARIVRAGQKRKTFIYTFVSTKAEARIATILQNKGELSKETRKLFEEFIP